MAKTFYSTEKKVVKCPRSKRRRNAYQSSTGASGGTQYIVSGGSSGSSTDGHTHANKGDLDKLSVDDGYVYVTDTTTDVDDDGKATVTTETEKVKAGEADHAAKAKVLDDDSPVLDWFLSKTSDDATPHTLTMGALNVSFDATIGGSATITGDMSADGGYLNDLSVSADAEVGNSLTVDSRTYLNGDTTFGQYSEGGLAAPTLGAKIDKAGNGDMRSLRLWEWLEVPELRYNRVNVYTGIRWDTFGAGIIEAVDTEKQLITLKLEDGEVGAIAENDLCMGIWHDTEDESGNATETSDDRKGNFLFAGFKTIYFRITSVPGQIDDAEYLTDEDGNTLADNAGNELVASSSIITNSRNQYCYYELENGCTTHPFVGMHFAARGNTTNTERQSFIYTTTEYSLMLTNVNQWAFTDSMIVAIQGKLDGFSMTESDGTTKSFVGYGQVFGNAYIYGHIEQFERAGVRLEYTGASSVKPGVASTYTLTAYKAFDAVKITEISVSKSGTGGTVPVSSYTYNADGTASFSLTMSADYTGEDYTLHVTATTESGTATTDIVVVVVRDGADGEKGDKGDTGAQGDKGDKGSDGRILRPCGKWAINTEYVYNDSFVDVVYFSTNKKWYACKKTNKNIMPLNSVYWEEANQMKFVATDLLLAESSYIKNLLVDKVTTSTEQNTQRTIIEGNTFEIYGTEDTPNIKVGIDENGCAYFQFLKNGSVIWELSPSGLNKVAGQGEAWEIEQMVCVNNMDALEFQALTSADLYPEYRYYAAWDYDANGDVIWKLTNSTTEPVYNQRLHEYGAKTLGTYVEDGWYIMHEDGMVKTSYSNTMSRFVYLVIDGQVGEKKEVFFKAASSDFYTDYSGGTKVTTNPLTYPIVSTTSEETEEASEDTTTSEE